MCKNDLEPVCQVEIAEDTIFQYLYCFSTTFKEGLCPHRVLFFSPAAKVDFHGITWLITQLILSRLNSFALWPINSSLTLHRTDDTDHPHPAQQELTALLGWSSGVSMSACQILGQLPSPPPTNSLHCGGPTNRLPVGCWLIQTLSWCCAVVFIFFYSSASWSPYIRCVWSLVWLLSIKHICSLTRITFVSGGSSVGCTTPMSQETERLVMVWSMLKIQFWQRQFCFEYLRNT